MKKKYVYIFPPILGLVIFGVIYWQYNSGYEARLAESERKEKAIIQAKLDEDARNRKVAVESAIAAQEKRKVEKLAQDAKDAADKDRREKAMQAKYRAQREADKLASQVKRLQKEIEDEKKEIAKVEEDKKRVVDEAAFQREYVKKAEDNVRSLQTVLDRIAAADAAAEAAAKAAAAAAAAAVKK
jgi:hypothetical protein